MQNYSKFDEQTQGFFNSLPIFLQEDIMQSGVQFSSKSDMESYVRNLLQPEQNKDK